MHSTAHTQNFILDAIYRTTTLQKYFLLSIYVLFSSINIYKFLN